MAYPCPASTYPPNSAVDQKNTPKREIIKLYLAASPPCSAEVNECKHHSTVDMLGLPLTMVITDVFKCALRNEMLRAAVLDV